MAAEAKAATALDQQAPRRRRTIDVGGQDLERIDAVPHCEFKRAIGRGRASKSRLAERFEDAVSRDDFPREDLIVGEDPARVRPGCAGIQKERRLEGQGVGKTKAPAGQGAALFQPIGK